MSVLNQLKNPWLWKFEKIFIPIFRHSFGLNFQMSHCRINHFIRTKYKQALKHRHNLSLEPCKNVAEAWVQNGTFGVLWKRIVWFFPTDKTRSYSLISQNTTLPVITNLLVKVQLGSQILHIYANKKDFDKSQSLFYGAGDDSAERID